MSTATTPDGDPLIPATRGGTDRSTGRTSLDALLTDRVVVERIQRGPNEVRFLADSSRPDVVDTVVKIEQNGECHPRELYDLHLRLCGASDDDGSPSVAARPLGWAEDPFLFAYEYIDGVPVKERIESLASNGPGWPEELSALARACGALLARFHQRLGWHGEDPSSAGRVHQACRRMVVGDVPPPGLVVRSLCDSGPHNLIVDSDDRVRLIDLPTDVRWTFAEFDIGVLAHRLARRAAIAFQSRASAGEAHRVFTRPLCEGYADTAGAHPVLPEVFAAYASSSFVFAKRSLTVRHPHASLAYARRDVGWGFSTLRAGRAARSADDVRRSSR